MKEYEVLAEQVFIHSGKLRLDPELADARAHLLEPTSEPDVYLVLKPVGFKQGLRFGHDGQLDKRTVLALYEVDAGADEALPDDEEPPANDIVPPESPVAVAEATHGPNTVGALAGQLKLELADTLALLKEYGIEASDENAVLNGEIFQVIVDDKTTEQE